MTKILIVEDDQFLQKMYKQKFLIEKYEVETATNGEEGLAKMKSFKPDLVLMDIMMPKLSGMEALEKAKADAEIKDIPILIISNLSSTDDAISATKKGAVGYIVKSDVTPGQVVEKVKAILSSK